MFSEQVLVLKSTSGRCYNPTCDQVPSLLSASLPSVHVHCATDLQDYNSAAEPAVVLLQFYKLENLLHRAEDLRGRFRRSSLVAILCGISDENDVPVRVLHALDDYLCCPFRTLELILRVRLLLGHGGSFDAARQVGRDDQLRDVVGDSQALQKVIAKIPLIAACDTTCLLEGETGTGKELFARAIHYMSPRRAKPFVPVNCGAIPDHLVENELFGHVKGAYTDAAATETGLVTYAEDGTLFLDEVDALSLSAQVKLLRLLQEREYRQLGAARILKSNARIIAATNIDLKKKTEAKQFRDDLYHRLNVLRLFIPSLRERTDDIPLLAQYFLWRYAKMHCKNTRRIDASALRRLTTYSWPGNVRELEGVIQRAVVMSESASIQAEDIDLPDLLYPDQANMPSSLSAAKARVVEQFERSYLIEMLTTHDGNITHAARAAGKERRSFQRLLRKHSIDVQQFRAPKIQSVT